MLLDITTNENDVGVHADSNLTFEHHVEDEVNKANRIRRSYTYLDGPTMTKLHTSLIRLRWLIRKIVFYFTLLLSLF